ncbi:NADPH:quinone oxidoreductase family protein [Streptomyces sp. SID13666]|uniref:quinone oxidoreductase family protein n=1 Tax=unclassified Streptomyces TaxID=2593676 RepID=UPI0013BF8924|nr:MULTISPECIES: NADPH:quinone oxidoreductase family protein [unclassified Streptomyces]NEA53916.1 NADPH:quinone oxidoreductase family protein [Streptomyces sp. SID13666]NEA76217.1 NADPH:quinone oxidoreductase family protein [Streptomyces sp. SID13588]
MRAIQITEFGGPEVLRQVELPAPEAQPGHLLVEVSSAGINFADTHTVEDSYLSRSTLPMVPGAEVVGRTSDGRRVVALADNGGYAEIAAVREYLAHDVPEGVSDGQALALIVQGLTAWHLLRTSARIAAGESVVVHAAAGGTGSLAVQLAKSFGAGRVIATASTKEKRDLALELGADIAVDADAEGMKDRLVEANDGKKVDIVLEMTGGPVFDASLAALAPFGRLVTYGMASRVPPTPVQAAQLMGRSRAVVGFWLMHCLGRPGMYREPMAELLAMTAEGRLKPQVGGVYPLADAARAHEDIRARRTHGKLILDVTR